MAKAPLASLYAEDAEEERLVSEIKDTYAKLRGALDTRQQLFDPVLLAMAQGFLAPTKTGSFGESLANVASLVGPAQEAETKRQTELAKMRLELAQGELGMRQAARGEEDFRSLLSGKGLPVRTPAGAAPAGAPAAGAAPAAAPAGAPAAAPAAGEAAAAPKSALGTPLPEGRQQAEGAPAGFANITPRDIAILASRPGMEGRAKILGDMLKAEQDRYAIAMNGTVFDKVTKKYLDLPIPGQKQEEFETEYGTFRMLPYEYSQYMNAVSEGKGEEWMKNWRGAGRKGAPGRRTVQDIAAQQQAASTAATETAKAETGRTQSAIERAEDYTGRMAQYRALDAIASRKDANEIFGIFNRPDFGSFVATLISENLKTPGAGNTISVPALQDAFRNLGLPQDTINKYQTALSIMATIQLQQAKLAAGQGSVSNFERNLFADASISPRDNPGTIRAKVEMLKARADFDREVAKELRRSKMSLDDFKDQKEELYQRMVDRYLDRVTNVAMGIGIKPQGGGAGPKAPATGAPYGAARDKLREELGL